MKFSPIKYKLIHLTRSRTKFNLGASAYFKGTKKQPIVEVQVLGV
jgi:hypothetical protein